MRSRERGRYVSRRRNRPGKRGRRRGEATAQPPADSPMRDGHRIGELRLHRDGYGFVVADRPDLEDVFVPARFVGDAMHTDTVEVRVFPSRRREGGGARGKAGNLLEGRIVRVVARGVTRLMGRFERHGSVCQVVADDRRVRHRILVPPAKAGKARHGDNVVVHILRYPEGAEPMLGEVVEVLGRRGEVETERTAVIIRHQLKRDFSAKTKGEAGELGSDVVLAAHLSGRRDLRSIPFVTIDGETAKDFDDAVAVERLPHGMNRLFVSIADVSHFVKIGSALDREAYERGTSVYFPGDCLPMLPEELSNDLCSLKPRCDRLTVTAEMDFGADGERVSSRFYRSVIHSRERMTYTAVRKLLLDRDPAERGRYAKLLPDFELMEELFTRLRGRRLARGSIDFDLPEPEIVMDMQGDIADIVKAERHVGHMMIEEFMIAANESVAEFLTAAKVGCIYRVHERPPAEKLREFSIMMHNLGHHVRLDSGAQPGKIAKALAMVRGRPEERLVNHMMLRSMSQAVYSPENVGHFGLASRCYCHFTSPIRRYPDLVVHRLLTARIKGTGVPSHQRTNEPTDKRTNIRLREIAEHCSRRERIAMESEREVAKLYAAMFMQEKVGECFDGIISHVTKFGFFVELMDYFVEGLVHINTLDDDSYHFEEGVLTLTGRRTKRVFKIGGRVRIEVEEVDVPNREIMFTLV